MICRILYLHHQPKLGGAERSLLNLFAGLDRKRFAPMLAGPAAGPFPDAARALGVPVRPLEFQSLKNLPALFSNAWKIARFARAAGVGILHGQTPRTNLPAALAGRLAGIPAVWHARVLLEAGLSDWDRRFACLPRAIICNSDAIRARFAGIPHFAEKTVTIRNGVDTAWFAPDAVERGAARRPFGISANCFVYGCFDRLDPVKNHEVILRAFRTVHAAHPGTCLLIVGAAFINPDGRRAELEHLAADLGLGTDARFAGFMDDVRAGMAACDAIVQASRSEGCSRAICEALAMGRPVIAARVGGNPELVTDGENGLLFPDNDAAALAAALDRLLTEPGLAARLGAAARERALKELSLAEYVRKTEAVYTDCRDSY